MKQIFGNFIRYDSDTGFLNNEDVKFNAIDVDELEGCLIIFRVANDEVYDKLLKAFTDEAVAEIGASILILKDEMIKGIDILDITEAQKITLRQDPKLAERAKKREDRKKNEKELDSIIEEVAD